LDIGFGAGSGLKTPANGENRLWTPRLGCCAENTLENRELAMLAAGIKYLPAENTYEIREPSVKHKTRVPG
jgi:hypothetical protein